MLVFIFGYYDFVFIFNFWSLRVSITLKSETNDFIVHEICFRNFLIYFIKGYVVIILYLI